jgi:ABC-2 type transport system permease protein
MAAAVKTKSVALVTILIVFLIVLVVNLLSLNIFARWDMTENKIYSISEPSKKIIANLDDRLTVKVFFTEDLPAPHNTDRRYLHDLLDDFKAFSGGRMTYEFLDPLKEENQQEAMSYRLQPVRFDIRGSTKAEQILGYKAIVLLYEGKQETMPFLMNMDNFEYDFVRLVKKLYTPNLPRLGFAFGHGELPLEGRLRAVQQILQEDYEILPVDLTAVPEIPRDLEVLLITAPKQEFTDKDLYLIDQYIMRGGKVAFFLNSYEINQAAGSLDPVSTGLDPLLNYYGVGLNKDYVVDKSCHRYMNLRRVEGGMVPENVEVPFFIHVLNFNQDNLAVKFQKTLSMIGASSLDTAFELQPGLKREVLFSTTEKSGTVTGDIGMQLQMLDESAYNQSHIPLAVVISGMFKSYYADRPVPQISMQPGDSIAPPALPEKIADGVESRILVVGNGNFFDDNAAQDRSRKFQQNFAFFRNIVDWLAQDEDLITIRSKSNIYNPITKLVSDSGQTTIRLVNVFTMPLLVIIFGIVRWLIRRSSKRRALV